MRHPANQTARPLVPMRAKVATKAISIFARMLFSRGPLLRAPIAIRLPVSSRQRD